MPEQKTLEQVLGELVHLYAIRVAHEKLCALLVEYFYRIDLTIKSSSEKAPDPETIDLIINDYQVLEEACSGYGDHEEVCSIYGDEAKAIRHLQEARIMVEQKAKSDYAALTSLIERHRKYEGKTEADYLRHTLALLALAKCAVAWGPEFMQGFTNHERIRPDETAKMDAYLRSICPQKVIQMVDGYKSR